jgi:predicted oxidoreductase
MGHFTVYFQPLAIVCIKLAAYRTSGTNWGRGAEMTLQVVHRAWLVVLAFCIAGLAACGAGQSGAGKDADVIIIGAGLSGLSAAVETGRSGLNVLVIDMNSVAGGHAMLAGGVAMVATPLQERLGIEDSAELAYRDWMDWTEDGDTEWTRYYASNSREMIYDWVTEMGVEFVRIVPGHGNSVPRFHFTKGRAAHLVLPIFRAALMISNVSFRWNWCAEKLLLDGNRVTGVVIRDLRSGEVRNLLADNVVLATGGFETDVDRVLANWITDLPQPDRLLIGAAISAMGSGHDMAAAAGAALERIDRHYIYINGFVDPRDPQQNYALTAGNDNSLWVNASGRRFTNEAGFDKDILVNLLQQERSTYWMVFDEAARDSFRVRGAAWLKSPSQAHPILDNPEVVKRAKSLRELAAMVGLPDEALVQSVREFNTMIDAGEDTAFGRFSHDHNVPSKVQQAPFYAIQMFPMTRKNMGGVAIDEKARVLDRSGQVLPGLYAVGELNGSLGINGKHGLDGMFLGPAILSGRLAGQSIAAATTAVENEPEILSTEQSGSAGAWQPTMTSGDLEELLAEPRDGYWHFQVSHRLVLERRYICTSCHSEQLPFSSLNDRSAIVAQTRNCTTCH